MFHVEGRMTFIENNSIGLKWNYLNIMVQFNINEKATKGKHHNDDGDILYNEN